MANHFNIHRTSSRVLRQLKLKTEHVLGQRVDETPNYQLNVYFNSNSCQIFNSRYPTHTFKRYTLYYNDVDEVKILRSINQHVNLLTNICIFYLIASPNQELSTRIEINCKFHTGLFKPARSAHTSEPSPVKWSNKPGYQRSSYASRVCRFDKRSLT